MRFSVDIACSLVFSLSNLKIPKTEVVKTSFIYFYKKNAYSGVVERAFEPPVPGIFIIFTFYFLLCFLHAKNIMHNFLELSISERRIADVQKSRNLIAAETKMDFSDAAGFRKPIKFNCISCSRPVELPLRGPLQSNLPAPRGVRTKRSKGPYLSYEMDQVSIFNCIRADCC